MALLQLPRNLSVAEAARLGPKGPISSADAVAAPRAGKPLRRLPVPCRAAAAVLWAFRTPQRAQSNCFRGLDLPLSQTFPRKGARLVDNVGNPHSFVLSSATASDLLPRRDTF